MSAEKDMLAGLTQELRRGTVILCVLSQVKEPRYGYDLVRSLEKKGIDIETNTLYPLLRRLEKQGMLQSIWDTAESKPRKYYKITIEGERIFTELKQQWMSITEHINLLLKEED